MQLSFDKQWLYKKNGCALEYWNMETPLAQSSFSRRFLSPGSRRMVSLFIYNNIYICIVAPTASLKFVERSPTYLGNIGFMHSPFHIDTALQVSSPGS